MRKLGSAQLGLLRLVEKCTTDGLTKDHMLGGDWRVIDRLEKLGLVTNRFVRMQGPTYFINEAGRAALSASASSQSRGAQ